MDSNSKWKYFSLHIFSFFFVDAIPDEINNRRINVTHYARAHKFTNSGRRMIYLQIILSHGHALIRVRFWVLDTFFHRCVRWRFTAPARQQSTHWWNDIELYFQREVVVLRIEVHTAYGVRIHLLRSLRLALARFVVCAVAHDKS